MPSPTGRPTTRPPGIDTLERRRTGTLDDYDPIATEGTFLRPTTDWDKDYWRIMNPLTANGYVLQPGELRRHRRTMIRTASGTSAALALNSSQIDDPNTQHEHQHRPVGHRRGAGRRQAPRHLVPRDVRARRSRRQRRGLRDLRAEVRPPDAVRRVGLLAKNAYTCNSQVSVTMIDTDLAGQGTATLGVSSGTERCRRAARADREPGGIRAASRDRSTRSPGAAVNGDGKISVAHGDTIDGPLPGRVLLRRAQRRRGQDREHRLRHALDHERSRRPGSEPGDDRMGHERSGEHGRALRDDDSDGFLGRTGRRFDGARDDAERPVRVHHVLLLGRVRGRSRQCRRQQQRRRLLLVHDGPDARGDPGQRRHAPGDSDNNPTGATSTIAVADTSIVQDVNVTVNITHTYDHDLTLSLTTPANTPITLAAARGGSSNNFTNTALRRRGGVADLQRVGAVHGVVPARAAAGLGGRPVGRRQLEVQGRRWASQDTGTINNWTLKLTYPDLACAPRGNAAPVPDGAIGTEMAASRMAGSGIHVTWDVATCVAENYHLLYGTLQNVSSRTRRPAPSAGWAPRQLRLGGLTRRRPVVPDRRRQRRRDGRDLGSERCRRRPRRHDPIRALRASPPEATRHLSLKRGHSSPK